MNLRRLTADFQFLQEQSAFQQCFDSTFGKTKDIVLATKYEWNLFIYL